MGGAGGPQDRDRAGRPVRPRPLPRRHPAAAEFGRVDILVSNAAEQHARGKLEDITDAEWDRARAVNLSAFFRLTRASLPYMQPGGPVVSTTSVNSGAPTRETPRTSSSHRVQTKSRAARAR
jgi:NAD(P)-dependent dehydrogenase (short-subunit alcohol dehydrogenase family)